MHYVLRNCAFWAGAHDLSGSMNNGTLAISAADVEDNAFGRERGRLAGLIDTQLQLAGNTPRDGKTDADRFDRLAEDDVPMTVCPVAGDVGEVAHMARTVELEYQTGGGVGDASAWSAQANGSGDPPVRGLVLHPNAERDAAGDGDAVQLGSVDGGQRLYAVLHVFAISSGGSLEVTVESDDAEGFAAPTSRIDFDQAADVGAQWKTLAGPVADDWLRVAWQVTGTASFAVAVGIR